MEQPTSDDPTQTQQSTSDSPLSVPLERFQVLERTVRDHPVQVDPYLELARIYLDKSRWLDAKRILDQAVERFPESEDAHYLREESQLNRSLQLLSVAEGVHAEEPTKLTLEAVDRCKMELNVLRERIFRSRLRRHPQKLDLYIPLSNALVNLGQHDEATQCLEKAVVDPNLRAKAALKLGELLEQQQRIPEALSAYRKAAFFRIPMPSEAVKIRALSAAADLAERVGMIDSAIRYIEELAELQPHNKALHSRLETIRKKPL